MKKHSLVMPSITEVLGGGAVRALVNKAQAQTLAQGKGEQPASGSVASAGKNSKAQNQDVASCAGTSGTWGRAVLPKKEAGHAPLPASAQPKKRTQLFPQLDDWRTGPTAPPRSATSTDAIPAKPLNESFAQAAVHKKIVRLVDKQVELNSQAHKAQLSFVPSWAVSASFPYRDRGETTVWSRSTKKHALILQSGFFRDSADPAKFVPLGLPYGVYARYIFIWMATSVQAALSKNRFAEHPVEDKDLRVLDLAKPYAGKPLVEFLFPAGATPSYGPRGTLTSTVRQLQRLAALKVAITLNPHDSAWQSKQMLLLDEASLSTLMTLQGNAALQARIVLSERFFETIRESCVPLNWELVYALGKSPQAIDLYAWLSHQCYITNHFRKAPVTVSWAELYDHFGGESTTWKFAEIFRRNLLSVRLLWPALDKGCVLGPQGLTLAPGVELTVVASSTARIANKANVA